MHGIDETVHIPEGPSVAAFLGKVASLNRRAGRVGLAAGLACVEVGREPREVRVVREAFVDGSFRRVSETRVRPCVLFRLTCPEPEVSIPGWSFEGWITAKGGKRDVATGEVRTASYTPFHDGGRLPPDILASAFSETGMMRCDHCGTFRNRRIGIVVRDAAGGRKVVGKACARDFLGHDFTVVAARYQVLDRLRRDMDAERASGWYRLAEHDFEAERAAAAEARARADAVVRPLRTVVGAILAAMDEQGFFARTDWEGRKATAGEARRMMDEGFEPSDGMREGIGAVMAWMRGQEAYAGLFASGDAVTMGSYVAADPEFRVVKAYQEAGHVPLGRFHADGDVVRIRAVSTSYEPGERQEGWRTVAVHRNRHVFEDDEGSRFEILTTSASVDAAAAAGTPFEARIRVRRTRVSGVRACTDLSRLTPVARRAGGAGKARAGRP